MLVLFFKDQSCEQSFFIYGHGGEVGVDSRKCLTIETRDILPEMEISTQIINNSVAFPTETEDVR